MTPPDDPDDATDPDDGRADAADGGDADRPRGEPTTDDVGDHARPVDADGDVDEGREGQTPERAPAGDEPGDGPPGGEGSGDESGGPLDALDPSRIALYAVLGTMIAFYLTPLETGLLTSFKTQTGVANSLPFAPPGPGGFTLSKWVTAFDELGRGLLNSALYAIPATLISAAFGSLAAYGLTQAEWDSRYKGFVLALFVAGIFIPYQAVLIPLTRFWSNYVQMAARFRVLGINDDYAAIVELIGTHVAYGIPICTILFRSYYKDLSDEMIESARLDGASLRRVYRRIVLPLSTPMFAVVLIYQFTQIWNDLLFALVLIQTTASDAAPSVLILAGLGVSQAGTDFGLQMAGALLTALPTIAVYVFFSEEFSEGVAT